MSMLAVFGAGALLMRGAGCTINDLWDRDIDGKVARTKLRPLASGALQPRHAIGFLAAQLTAGLGVLLQLNYNSILLGAASLPLVVIYPLMKRYTNWPQLVLGLAFNWGALLGWVAVRDVADLSVMLPLYAAGVSWTIVYDTIYALQDTRDDRKLGLKSTALHFGDNFRPILSGFSAITIGSLAVAGYNAGCGTIFTSLACVGGAAHLAWQISTVDATRVGDCAKKFIANKWFGALVFAAIVADRWMAVPEPERSPADAPKL
jgi:4-hydroxybenzoate polyprenyltransferase